MDPLFLSLDEVLEIHQQQIERYGGSNGIRDVAGLESAIATPQATFDEDELADLVLAIAAGIVEKPELIQIYEARCRPLPA
jgi:death-on-curing protein